MALKYKIKITPTAYADLSRIEKNILSTSLSATSADKWANLILSRIYDLDMFPMRNSNTIKIGNIRLWHVTVKHKYVIHYQILTDKKIVKIRRILPRNMEVTHILNSKF